MAKAKSRLEAARREQTSTEGAAAAAEKRAARAKAALKKARKESKKARRLARKARRAADAAAKVLARASARVKKLDKADRSESKKKAPANIPKRARAARGSSRPAERRRPESIQPLS